MKKISATVITGFLGSGKTSIIRHIAKNNKGKRLAFLINEFGDLGIDRDILLGCGIEGCSDDDVVELANGCICCTVGEDFLPAIQKILEKQTPPDHIIIETSGLALPKPLLKAFTWPEVRNRVTIDGVITVCDAPALLAGRFASDEDLIAEQRLADEELDHESPLEELFEDQLSAADIVLVNKCDLIDEADVPVVYSYVAPYLRPGVSLITTQNAEIDPDILLGISAQAEDDLDVRKSHHDGVDDDHDHDDFTSMSLSFGAVDDIDLFEEKLRAIINSHDILRVKGFLYRPNTKRREVLQAAGPRISRYFDRAWHEGEEKKSHLVIIGFHDLQKGEITRALQ